MEKTRIRLIRFLAVVVVSIGICSCGYQLVQEKGIFGGDITTLYLPVFKNVTYEPHASLYVTDAFSRELTGSGLFVMNKDGADGYIEGTIRRIGILPSSMDKNGVVVEKQATVDVDLALYKKGGAFVKRWSLTDWEVYRCDDVNAEDYNKRNALRIISARMARKFSAAVLIDY
jgi:outer membrane lipopolysaccharide assembly protein LptE/RlpB